MQKVCGLGYAGLKMSWKKQKIAQTVVCVIY